MRKRKLDPKIIRAGDKVKIVNPEVFVRCGYPLCKADLKEEIYQHYGKLIEDIMYSVGKGNKLISRNEESLFPAADIMIDPFNNKFIDELASIRLRAKKFGGNERKIFTKRYEDLKDKVFYVRGTRFVQTGFYVPGDSSQYYSEYDDFTPPYLDKAKTHKILIIDLTRREIDEDFRSRTERSRSMFIRYQLIEIEAIHVEKLPDDREYLQDKNGNWIKNEMYHEATV